jgi:hypothetical protein
MGRTQFNKRLINSIRILLVIALIVEIFNLQYLNIFVTLLALLSTFIPDILSDKAIVHTPTDLHVIMVLFAFAAIYLGELRNFYYRFWWWDTMLHTFSGIILGFSGLVLIYIINKNEKIDFYLSPLFISIFAFTFAVTIGVLWEVFEFFMDSTFGLNMQKSGLVDTMWDLIADAIGGMIAGIYGYQYVTTAVDSYFEKAVEKFLKINKQFFD